MVCEVHDDHLANSYRKRRTQPIFYRVAIAEETLSGGLTIRNWRNTRTSDVASFPLYLLLKGGSTRSVIDTFRNIENLTIWHNPITLEVLEKTNNLPLRMFTVGLEHLRLDEASKNCSAFRNITHLKIILTFTRKDCKALVNSPKLTHLCIFSQDEDMLTCCRIILPFRRWFGCRTLLLPSSLMIIGFWFSGIVCL